MIAIKDMEMPTTCRNCPFECYYENLGGHICDFLEKTVDDNERWRKRLDDCPLVEIVTCKDCKWWTKGMCLKWLISTDEDFYCANGERRE